MVKCIEKHASQHLVGLGWNRTKFSLEQNGGQPAFSVCRKHWGERLLYCTDTVQRDIDGSHNNMSQKPLPVHTVLYHITPLNSTLLSPTSFDNFPKLFWKGRDCIQAAHQSEVGTLPRKHPFQMCQYDLALATIFKVARFQLRPICTILTVRCCSMVDIAYTCWKKNETKLSHESMLYQPYPHTSKKKHNGLVWTKAPPHTSPQRLKTVLLTKWTDRSLFMSEWTPLPKWQVT